MATATITSKGQVTIPKAVRDQLHLEPGDRLDFVTLDDGRVVIHPATIGANELEGLLYRRDRKPVSVEHMNTAVRNMGKQ